MVGLMVGRSSDFTWHAYFMAKEGAAAKQLESSKPTTLLQGIYLMGNKHRIEVA